MPKHDPELEKRFRAIEEVDPDAFDLEMIDRAQTENDGTYTDGEAFFSSLDQYSGKLSLRVPRSLHRALALAAEAEGVSLDQYASYKLSRGFL